MFIQVIKSRTSHPDEVRELAESWRSDVGAPPGWLGSTFGITADGTVLGIVRFASREAAMANSDRPEQTAFAERMSALMDGPIEFHDSVDVFQFLDGGSDDAGFVQVIRGQSSDIGIWARLLGDPTQLHAVRPDIIGGTVAIEADGSFTETVAFTDEANAREGERNGAFPPDTADAFHALLAGATFYDLRDPWFDSP
jgi:hypothetical protein